MNEEIRKGKSKTTLIERKWAMPNKNTFYIRPIRELIEEEMKKKPGT